MNRANLWVLSSVLAMAACSNSGAPETDTGATPGSNIPVTRSECTPFGATPRSITPVVNDLTPQTCLGLVNGVAMEGWTDADGTARTACLFEPASASADHKLPLIIYLHASVITSDVSLGLSNVLDGLETADLSGDPARPGFILVAPAGRTTEHFYSWPIDNAIGWDNWYRQLDPLRRVNGSEFPINVDAAAIDHFASEVIATGKVDLDRVYVVGYSNGASMGILYALNRSHVAAAAVYSAPSPFAYSNDPCKQDAVRSFPGDDTQHQVSHPGVPIMHIYNACDAGGSCPNSVAMQAQLQAAGVTDIHDVIIDGSQTQVAACDAACGTNPQGDYGNPQDPSGYFANPMGFTLGVVNHGRWPSNWTDEMFAYLRAHPRS
ncbi:MAG TPA: hypothetical protein VLI06_19260 [Solimonas sp.]|nr:hypothetical protein [Solimonas sp.]